MVSSEMSQLLLEPLFKKKIVVVVYDTCIAIVVLCKYNQQNLRGFSRLV